MALLADGASHATAPSPGGWLLPVLVVVVPVAAYLSGAARLRGAGRAWSGARTASFLCGALLVGLAVSPVMHADTAGGHMARHLVLGMFAPLALVLGAPGTLLLAVLPVVARRPVAAALRSRPLHALSHVTTAAVLSVGGLYLLYLTPLYAASTRWSVVHHLVHLHFLLSGYLYAWAVAGPDPAPRRPGMAVRLAVLVAAGGAHAYLAKLLYSRAPELPAGSGFAAGEIRAAAQLMFYGGHLAELLVLVALFAAWYRRGGRAHRRAVDAAPTRA